MRGALLLLLGLSGCAFSDGDFLTTLLPGTLSAQLSAPAERFTTDGWLITSENYDLRLDTLSLLLGDLTISGFSGPDGMTEALVALPVMAEVPVATHVPATALAGVALSGCRPRCGLGPLTLTAGDLSVQHLRLHGKVRRHAASSSPAPAPPPTEQVLDIDLRLLPLDGVSPLITQRLNMPLHRDLPAHLQLSVQVQIGADLGDAIDFGVLPQKDGALCLSRDVPACQQVQAEQQLSANLLHGSLTLDFMQPAE